MPELRVEISGKGGAFADKLRGKRIIEPEKSEPVMVETLDAGMTSGAPSVSIMVEISGGRVVLAQTSVKLFQMAAYAMLSRYGDLTEGGVLGHFVQGGKAELTLSPTVNCKGCNKPIPSSCNYCFHCGEKL